LGNVLQLVYNQAAKGRRDTVAFKVVSSQKVSYVCI
jgi:hypothetical protein